MSTALKKSSTPGDLPSRTCLTLPVFQTHGGWVLRVVLLLILKVGQSETIVFFHSCLCFTRPGAFLSFTVDIALPLSFWAQLLRTETSLSDSADLLQSAQLTVCLVLYVRRAESHTLPALTLFHIPTIRFSSTVISHLFFITTCYIFI